MSASARPLLAFRPVSAVHRLPPGSQACPLSLRDLLGAVGGRPLALVTAPLPAVARGALLAAAQAGAAVGLALPAGRAVEPWFDAVCRAADEVAPRLPIFLSAEVAAEGSGETAVAGATRAAHRLVEGGITHLALDLSALGRSDRSRAAAEAAAFAVEREIAVDCVLPGAGGFPDPDEARSFAGELREGGLAPDAFSVRCPSPDGPGELRVQARALAALVEAIAPIRLVRRGLAPRAFLPALAAAGVAVAGDGERVLEAGLRALPAEARALLSAPPERGPPPAVGGEAGERLEALCYAEAAAFLEEIGSAGTAGAAVEALAAR